MLLILSSCAQVKTKLDIYECGPIVYKNDFGTVDFHKTFYRCVSQNDSYQLSIEEFIENKYIGNSLEDFQKRVLYVRDLETKEKN